MLRTTCWVLSLIILRPIVCTLHSSRSLISRTNKSVLFLYLFLLRSTSPHFSLSLPFSKPNSRERWPFTLRRAPKHVLIRLLEVGYYPVCLGDDLGAVNNPSFAQLSRITFESIIRLWHSFLSSLRFLSLVRETEIVCRFQRVGGDLPRYVMFCHCCNSPLCVSKNIGNIECLWMLSTTHSAVSITNERNEWAGRNERRRPSSDKNLLLLLSSYWQNSEGRGRREEGRGARLPLAGVERICEKGWIRASHLRRDANILWEMKIYDYNLIPLKMPFRPSSPTCFDTDRASTFEWH